MHSILDGFVIHNEDLNILFNILLGLISGAIISAGYTIAHKNKKYSKNFAITILLMPALMTIVIPFIATDLKKAVSLAGVFALVRFRSIPGDSKDILYVFFTLAVGIVLGLNNYVIGFAATIIISLVFVLLKLLWNSEETQILKITIPEDMNYQNVFDDIFNKYLVKHSIRNVKTSNMGTLFQISYNVILKSDADVKAFLDELRTRNGNLTIIIQNTNESDIQSL